MSAKKSLKILSLPVDKGGCGWYRIRQPFEMIKAYTDHDAHVIDKDSDDMIAIAEALSLADVIVIRQGGEAGLPLLRESVRNYGDQIGEKREIKAKIVLDIDDNIELISPYSEHYKEYGIKEFFDKGINKWVWRDGEQGFDLVQNKARIESLKNAMRRVDLVTVTTDHLAEYARKYNKNVAVLPNCIDALKWWKLNTAPNKQLRVGWSGGISHYEDWYSIKEPLNKLLRKYRFKLISVGAHFSGIIDEDLRDLVEVWPWVPFDAHSFRMMCMELDIAIIPLANLPFNNYKSSIKFQEMSAMGVPSLVSNITPYKEEVTPEINGLVYDNPRQFEKGLEDLLKSEKLRQDIGQWAQAAQRENYDAKKNVNMWIDAYKNLL